MIEKIKLTVRGMSCAHGEMAVSKSLKAPDDAIKSEADQYEAA